MKYDLFTLGVVLLTLLTIIIFEIGRFFYNLGKKIQFKRSLKSYLLEIDELDGNHFSPDIPFKLIFPQLVKVNPKTQRAWVNGRLKIKYNDLPKAELKNLRSIISYNDNGVQEVVFDHTNTVVLLSSTKVSIPPIAVLGGVKIIPKNCSIECVLEPPIPVDEPAENLATEDIKQELPPL